MRIFALISILFFAIVGCSGQSTLITGGGTLCLGDYNPLPVDGLPSDNLTKQIELKDLPDGDYQFNGAEVFYKDTNNSTNTVYIHNRLTATSAHTEDKMVNVCGNNVDKLYDKKQNMSIPTERHESVLTGLTIKGGQITKYSKQTIGFKFNPEKDPTKSVGPVFTATKDKESTHIDDKQLAKDGSHLSLTDHLSAMYKNKFDKFVVRCKGNCDDPNVQRIFQFRAAKQQDNGGDHVLTQVMTELVLPPKP